RVVIRAAHLRGWPAGVGPPPRRVAVPVVHAGVPWAVLRLPPVAAGPSTETPLMRSAMATDLEALQTTRVTNGDDELPDTALFWRWVGKATRPVIGWVLTGIGVILIIVGYLGVSREALVAKQLPYLVSGGILGIAFVGFGAVLLGTEDI